jgi:hypothetical protein
MTTPEDGQIIMTETCRDFNYVLQISLTVEALNVNVSVFYKSA